jgi:hypothetical protein
MNMGQNVDCDTYVRLLGNRLLQNGTKRANER